MTMQHNGATADDAAAMQDLRRFARAIWDHLVYDMPKPEWFDAGRALCSNWWACLDDKNLGFSSAGWLRSKHLLDRLLMEHAGSCAYPFGRTLGPGIWSNPERLAFLHALADGERPLVSWRDYIRTPVEHADCVALAARDRKLITNWCRQMVAAFDHNEFPTRFCPVYGICGNLDYLETRQLRVEFSRLVYPFGGVDQYCAEVHRTLEIGRFASIPRPGTLWANPQRRAWVRKRAEGKTFHLSDIL